MTYLSRQAAESQVPDIPHSKKRSTARSLLPRYINSHIPVLLSQPRTRSSSSSKQLQAVGTISSTRDIQPKRGHPHSKERSSVPSLLPRYINSHIPVLLSQSKTRSSSSSVPSSTNKRVTTRNKEDHGSNTNKPLARCDEAIRQIESMIDARRKSPLPHKKELPVLNVSSQETSITPEPQQMPRPSYLQMKIGSRMEHHSKTFDEQSQWDEIADEIQTIIDERPGGAHQQEQRDTDINLSFPEQNSTPAPGCFSLPPRLTRTSAILMLSTPHLFDFEDVILVRDAKALILQFEMEAYEHEQESLFTIGSGWNLRPRRRKMHVSGLDVWNTMRNNIHREGPRLRGLRQRMRAPIHTLKLASFGVNREYADVKLITLIASTRMYYLLKENMKTQRKLLYRARRQRKFKAQTRSQLPLMKRVMAHLKLVTNMNMPQTLLAVWKMQVKLKEQLKMQQKLISNMEIQLKLAVNGRMRRKMMAYMTVQLNLIENIRTQLTLMTNVREHMKTMKDTSLHNKVIANARMNLKLMSKWEYISRL